MYVYMYVCTYVAILGPFTLIPVPRTPMMLMGGGWCVVRLHQPKSTEWYKKDEGASQVGRISQLLCIDVLCSCSGEHFCLRGAADCRLISFLKVGDAFCFMFIQKRAFLKR